VSATALTPAAPSAFGGVLTAHLHEQLASARRLLDAVLRQGAAIRARDVDGVLARLGEIQVEMEHRGRIEQQRTQVLTYAANELGCPAHAVTLDALISLVNPAEGAAAKSASAELRGLLAEIQREHTVNRALMRQELAFLSHLTRMLGVDAEDVGYRPPSEPGATMRATLNPAAAAGGWSAQRRTLNIEA
jgi:hypothetical protein